MMYAYSIVRFFSVFSGLLNSYNSQVDKAGCSDTPVEECTGNETGLDKCLTDVDCPRGGRCCYKGCFRECYFPQPCGSVMCQNWTVCQEETMPCNNPPCSKQANCISLDKYRCEGTVVCPQCLPGFDVKKDHLGCHAQPCECVPGPVLRCGSTCRMLCIHGFEEDEEGCLVCRCKKEPEHPCSERDCGPDTECRLVAEPCERSNCLCTPKDICVLKLKSPPFEDRCSVLDINTVGRPVLGTDLETMSSCADGHMCPDHTICVGMEHGINICCWQHTQARLYSSSPKQGDCPSLFAVSPSELISRCEIDAHCPGVQKCCYHDKSPKAVRHIGSCVDPLQVKIAKNTLCQNTPYGLEILRILNICPRK